MHYLKSFSFHSDIWGSVDLQPRLEKISASYSSYDSAEIVCSVTSQKGKINAEIFFSSISNCEHVEIFRLLLNIILADIRNLKYTISLNTPDSVVKNLSQFFKIFECNPQQKIALELNERNIDHLTETDFNTLNSINNFSNIFLWLDDFGTGKSNFEIVISNKISFSAIKVSKELFWELFSSDKKFLQSLLIYLGKRHKVVVEGVCSTKHFDFLSQINNVFMQGFIFMHKDEFVLND
tara:strand:- start:8715 stop:9425 length:711 start_codon:yes stop_codon:yes gene_type:complete